MRDAHERELTDHERAILFAAINTMSVGRDEAVAQLAVAKHGRPAHAGTHPCFFIDLPSDVESIPPGAQYPLTLWVEPDGFTVGSIELFIEAGRLDSLDWSETSLRGDGPEVTEFPTLDRISTEMSVTEIHGSERGSSEPIEFSSGD